MPDGCWLGRLAYPPGTVSPAPPPAAAPPLPETRVCNIANIYDQPLNLCGGRSGARAHPSIDCCSPTISSSSTTRRRKPVMRRSSAATTTSRITVGTTRFCGQGRSDRPPSGPDREPVPHRRGVSAEDPPSTGHPRSLARHEAWTHCARLAGLRGRNLRPLACKHIGSVQHGGKCIRPACTRPSGSERGQHVDLNPGILVRGATGESRPGAVGGAPAARTAGFAEVDDLRGLSP
jgi:hypothetical protein